MIYNTDQAVIWDLLTFVYLFYDKITKYGYVTFNKKYCSFLPLPLPVYVRNRVVPMVAPLHTDNDPQKTNGKIFYNVYEALDKFENLETWRIMSRADLEIQKVGKSSQFSATWLMTVTWYKMPPYPAYKTNGREVRYIQTGGANVKTTVSL